MGEGLLVPIDLKTHKAAAFGFLLPGAHKVLPQYFPAGCWIDEALLMGQYLLWHVELKDFLLHGTKCLFSPSSI